MATRAAWNTLPEEIVQVLGLHLDAEGWAAARSTCKGWRNIQSGIKLLEIDLERDAHRWMMVLTCVARLFPHLSCAILLVGNRISPALFQQRMEALAITGMKLQELELRFVYAAKPMIGSWLEDLSGVTHLRQLSVLRLAGGATPPPSFFAQLSGMRQLEVLELLPGAYGQALGDLDIDVASANAQGPVGEGGLADAHLEAIAQLTQLKKLTVKVIPGEVTPAGLNCLAASGLISQLRQLALYDSELPAGCLSSVLKGAGRLTSLQLGLSNVDDLGALGKLPQLQELSLDAAFLPELRELVYAAARGNIPAAGPGALTGLCLLDQTITSAAQLAALSQLSSLAELVLVNPVREPLPPPEDDDTEDEQPAAAAAAQQQQQQLQQQQQQDTGIDITALAGLAALRLLQLCTCVARAAEHFSGLQALWLEQVSLPRNLLAAGLTAAAASLESLALLQVSGTSQAELSLTLPGLTGLTSLRLLPSEHGLGGLGQLLPLRHLKKLNVKLLHLQPADLAILPRLRSLFCLALSAPLDGAGRLPPSAQRAPVKLGQVLDVVRDSLPYCDLELQAEAPAAGNGTA
ncbi:hypothetical protein OEZ85_000562 [Tetradesmus obliquus]|uniref:F-box domain-containing protein n=1 Tax=Tetradesmus obliquus TaxID=3088 RepID=A0ABY8UJM7_TETOB|nr:hypothetical protein OEZ85_000562 [Tetradesmus obliquus]